MSRSGREGDHGVAGTGSDGGSLPRIDRPLTLVAQVEQALRRAIERSAFPGGRLPTAVELAEQMGVSRETVRLAFEVLERDGLLVKRRRRGTFVSAGSVPPAVRLDRGRVFGYLQADYASAGSAGEVVTWPVSGAMFEGALAEAGRHGYQLVVGRARPSQLRTAFESLRRNGPVQGAIFASIAEEKFLRRIAGRNLPIVLVDHDLHLPKVSSVRSDSRQNSRSAVEHLVALGHRRIACAQWRQSDLNPWFSRGYREALRDAGVKRRRAWEVHVQLSRQGAVEATEQLFALSPRPTALLCFHNTFACYMIDQVRRRGLRVPEDFSVVGGGGEQVIDLTCNQIDWHDLGCRAMRLLLRAVEARDTYQPQHVTIPYTMIAGRTTASPPA